MTSDRRTQQRLATRADISITATRLFMERGFDQVTVDEVAAAAGVGRMTVFNHFPRKEDLFFDRDAQARELLVDALRQRDPAVPPIETLRRLAHQLVAQASRYVEFSVASQGFVDAIEASPALQARARAIRDELAQVVSAALAASVGRDDSDPAACFAGSVLLATWTVALTQGHRVFRTSADAAAASAAFLAIVDKGSLGLAAALAGTPYV